MYLVHPDILISDMPLPRVALRAYAQVLSEDFAQRIGIPVPRVIVSNHSEPEILACQSPVKRWVRWTRAGDLALTSLAYDPLQLQFAIAHALAHCAYALEWECDLEALTWMNDPIVPLVESTARAIARISVWRERVLQFKLGERVLAIGDALTSQVW